MAKIKIVLTDIVHMRLAIPLLISLAIFSIFGLSGYSMRGEESQKILEELMNLFGPLKELNVFVLVALIFFNNSLKALAAIFSGLAFGIGPLVFLVINGTLIGIVIKGASQQYGAMVTMISLLPHGILEIPSIILASALGFRLGSGVFQKILGKDSQVKSDMKRSLIIFVVIILPVLLIAALLEVFVTPLVVAGLVK